LEADSETRERYKQIYTYAAQVKTNAVKLPVMVTYAELSHDRRDLKNHPLMGLMQKNRRPICCNNWLEMRSPQQPSEHTHRNPSDQQSRKSTRKVITVNFVLCASYLLFLPSSAALSTLQLVGNHFGSASPLRTSPLKLVDNCANRFLSAGAGNNVGGSSQFLKLKTFDNKRYRRACHGLCSLASSHVTKPSTRLIFL
jgi:hypothetical protein